MLAWLLNEMSRMSRGIAKLSWESVPCIFTRLDMAKPWRVPGEEIQPQDMTKTLVSRCSSFPSGGEGVKRALCLTGTVAPPTQWDPGGPPAMCGVQNRPAQFFTWGFVVIGCPPAFLLVLVVHTRSVALTDPGPGYPLAVTLPKRRVQCVTLFFVF